MTDRGRLDFAANLADAADETLEPLDLLLGCRVGCEVLRLGEALEHERSRSSQPRCFASSSQSSSVTNGISGCSSLSSAAEHIERACFARRAAERGPRLGSVSTAFVSSRYQSQNSCQAKS